MQNCRQVLCLRSGCSNIVKKSPRLIQFFWYCRLKWKGYVLGIIVQVLHSSIFHKHICGSFAFLLPLEFLYDDNGVSEGIIFLLKVSVSEKEKIWFSFIPYYPIKTWSTVVFFSCGLSVSIPFLECSFSMICCQFKEIILIEQSIENILQK